MVQQEEEVNGRDWLRAMVLRQRKKGFATGGKVSGTPVLQGGCVFPVRMPAALPTGLRIELRDPTELEVSEFAERLRQAIGTPRTVPPQLPYTQAPGALPGGDAMWTGAGQQCGCEARYSACHCTTRNDRKETRA